MNPKILRYETLNTNHVKKTLIFTNTLILHILIFIFVLVN